MVPLIWLLGPPHLRWEWWAIIPSSPLVMIVFDHVMEVSCYQSFLGGCFAIMSVPIALGSFICKYLQAFNWSAQYVKFVRMTCKSASQSCLRIHLGCLTVLLKQSIWSPRLPQEVQRRSSRWAHTSFWVPLAPTIWLSGRICCFHLLALEGDQAPRKDDGTDFGCAWIHSNNLIALETKCY